MEIHSCDQIYFSHELETTFLVSIIIDIVGQIRRLTIYLNRLTFGPCDLEIVSTLTESFYFTRLEKKNSVTLAFEKSQEVGDKNFAILLTLVLAPTSGKTTTGLLH